LKNIGILLILLLTLSCAAPPIPPEVKLAEEQEHILWKSGAELFSPDQYNLYKVSLRKAKDALIQEKAGFIWFQDYRLVQSQFRDVLESGRALGKTIAEQKKIKGESIASQLSFFKGRIAALKGITEMINEGRLARGHLMKADLVLSEATARYGNGDYFSAEEKIKGLSGLIQTAEEAIRPILNRYTDRSQIRKWRRMAEETIAESKDRGIPVIVVDKSERTLTLYDHGVHLKTCEVGFGRNGSLDKLRAGDFSTPEGKYRIIEKIAQSRYHKALLINYPNEEDRRNFLRAKQKGVIPAQANIGGRIEIHGGGRDSVTYGCISMDNNTLDSLFHIVPVGTPVTIVGAVDYDNSLSSAIEGL
jgi:hypothetical protein